MGWGGARPGSGRKKQNGSTPRPRARPVITAQIERPRRQLDAHDYLKLIEQSNRHAGREMPRAPENCPFKLPDFPRRAIPPGGGMARDTALTADFNFFSADWLAQGTFTANIADGLVFPGYAYLAELAQRPEYRILTEILATEATRKWIQFQATGDKAKKKTDDDDGKKPSEESEPDREATEEINERQEGASDYAFDLLPSEEKNRRQSNGGGHANAGGAAPEPTPSLRKTLSGTTTEQDGESKSDKVKGAEKQDKIQELEEFLDHLRIKDHIANLCLLDGFFGRGHLFLDCGETTPEELTRDIGNGTDEMSAGKIGKGWLKAVRTIEPVWTYPQLYNAVDPLQPDWYNPQQWYVMGKQVHVSRLLKFVSRPVPDMLKPAYAFGGLSMSQMAQRYVNMWLRTSKSVNDLINAFSVMVLSTDMSEIGSPGATSGGVLGRVALFNAFRDNQNAFVLNKNTEEFNNVSAPLGGLHELQAQAMEHMAFVGRYPLVKFTGIQPSGLNADSEGVLRSFYDTVTAFQEKFLRPPLETIINIAQITLWGAIDRDITWDFAPMWELSEKEKGELQKADAERSQIYVDMGTVSPAEVRGVVVNDPELPFTGLDPEDVPELKEEEMEGLVPEGAGKGLETVLGAGGGEGPEPKKPGEGEEPGGEDDAVIPFAEEPEREPDWHRVSKARAKYQGEPCGVHKCSLCTMFVAPNQCETVDGRISPEGWCKYFNEASDGRMAADALAGLDIEWKEGEHPRSPDGKFGSGGAHGGGSKASGGGSQPSSSSTGSKQKLTAPQYGMVGGKLAASHKEARPLDIPESLKRSPGEQRQTLQAPQYGIVGGHMTASQREHRVKQGSEGDPASPEGTIVVSTGEGVPAALKGELHGVPFAKWDPPEDWAGVDGQAEIDEEPFEVPEGKTPASGVVIREPDGRVWLMQPKGGYGGYEATFPKGGIEEGLSPQANAIKEAYEETGLKVRITGHLGDGVGDTTYTRYYTAEREGGDPAAHGEETEGVVLTPVGRSKDFLNRSRDRSIAEALGADEWHESDHPRGQPGNAGQFGPGGGGGKAKSKSSGKAGTGAVSGPQLNSANLTKTGPKMGTNPGGVYKDKVSGKEFYIKKGETKAHVTNELTAANLYHLADSPILKYATFPGGEFVATEMAKLDKKNTKEFSPADIKEAQKDYAVHAWLANWDVAGTGGDNLGVVNGKVTSLDLGGALEYRAQGAPKGDAFGNKVTELNSLVDPKINPDTAKIFGSMTYTEKYESAKRVADISDDDIRETVEASGGGDVLVNKLIARKRDIAMQYSVTNEEFEDGHPRDEEGHFIKKGGGEEPKGEHAKAVAETVGAKAKGGSHYRTHVTNLIKAAKELGDKSGEAALITKLIESWGITHASMVKAGKADEAAKILAKMQKLGATETSAASAPPAPAAKKAEPKAPAEKEAEATFKTIEKLNEEYLTGATAQKAAEKPDKKFYPSEPPTEAELTKAKKTAPLQLQYLGIPDVPSTPAVNAALKEFNDKYSGKEVPSLAAQIQKVNDFKALQAKITGMLSEEKQKAIKAQAEQAEKAKAAFAEQQKQEAEKEAGAKKHLDEIKKELGLKTNEEAKAFEALASQYGSLKSAIAHFQAAGKQAEAKAKHYPGHGFENLSGFEMALIKSYTGSGYGSLNEALIEGNISPSQYAFKKGLNAALDKLPKFTGKTGRGLQLTSAQQSAFKPGYIWNHKNFASSSKTKPWSHKNTTLHIEATGNHGAWVDPISNAQGEDEVLYKSGVDFMVHKVEKSADGKLHVYCTEMA